MEENEYLNNIEKLYSEGKLHKITEEFLMKNLFSKPGQIPGYITYHYDDKRYEVACAPHPCGGKPFITINNKITHQIMTFQTEHNLLFQEDLHRCINFMSVSDEFEYDF